MIKQIFSIYLSQQHPKCRSQSKIKTYLKVLFLGVPLYFSSQQFILRPGPARDCRFQEIFPEEKMPSRASIITMYSLVRFDRHEMISFANSFNTSANNSVWCEHSLLKISVLSVYHVFEGTEAWDGLFARCNPCRKAIQEINSLWLGSITCRAMNKYVDLSAYANGA